MALLEVANEDLQVNFVIAGLPPDEIYYTGDQPIDAVKIVPTISAKSKAENKYICTTGIVLTWAGPVNQCPHTSATYTFVSGKGSISPLATKTKTETQLVLRKEDSGTCTGG